MTLRRSLEWNFWREIEGTVEGRHLQQRIEEGCLEFVRTQGKNTLEEFVLYSTRFKKQLTCACVVIDLASNILIGPIIKSFDESFILARRFYTTNEKIRSTLKCVNLDKFAFFTPVKNDLPDKSY